MPSTAADLLRDHPRPTVVAADDSLSAALEKMLEGDFSQLPVVDATGKPVALVTSDSILRAIRNFGVTPAKLRVRDAMFLVRREKIYRLDDDILELLDENRDESTILIVDGEDRLVGIITMIDVTGFFRRRAEDMMLVEDIETGLRDHVQAAFTKDDGQLDDSVLQTRISAVSTDGDLQTRFHRALTQYLEPAKPDGQRAAVAFDKHFKRNQTRAITDLSFYEVQQLVLDKPKWSPYGEKTFGIDKEALQVLLEGVRDTRNRLAHFKGDVAEVARDQLRFCNDWLVRHPPIRPQPSADAAPAATVESVAAMPPRLEDHPQEVDEVDGAEGNSRYIALAQYLQRLSPTIGRIELTFTEVEDILKHPLPPYARRHRAWWANDSVGHTQSKLWLEAGWRVSNLALADQVVEFARIAERHKAYIDFFSSVLSQMGRDAPSPSGANWISFASVSDGGRRVAFFNLAFALGGRFRIELLIDTGDGPQNKALLRALELRQDGLDSGIGAHLTWETLPAKRAARVALYYPQLAVIEGDDHADLRAWASRYARPFEATLRTALTQELQATS